MADDKQQTNKSRKIVVYKEGDRSKIVRVLPACIIKRDQEQPSVSGLTSSMRDINISGENSKAAIETTTPGTENRTKVTFSDFVTIKQISDHSTESESDTSEANVNQVTSPVPKGQGKLKFSEVFTINDPKEEYFSFMSKNKYDHAYDVLLKQHKCGCVGLQANHLKNCHQILLITGTPDEARFVRKSMISFMVENIEVNPTEIQHFANDLQHSDKLLDAILFQFIAAFFYKSTTYSKKLKTMDFCAYQMAQCIQSFLEMETELLEKTKSLCALREAKHELNVLANRHLIPMIVEIKDMISTTEDAPEKQHCLYEALSGHRIEFCQGLVNDHVGRIQTINEAMRVMDRYFGSKSEEMQLYGQLLNNLGTSYLSMSRFDYAAKYYQQAINSYKKSKDFSDPRLKLENIETSENNLEEARNKLLCRPA
ncbi:unnamed protein product [Clavelina lepadiformis]|uniref:Uncharacterized protein n=1 Tax=Clavelina lepadiformis TaxID=159417 RepID=A0ABP0F022_CLALP